MKVHIKKDKVENKGCFGSGKSWFSIYAHYELNEEEKQLLSKNKNVLGMIAFDFPYRGTDGVIKDNTFAIVKNLINEKDFEKSGGCFLGCVFSNGEAQEVEELINEGAKNLKAELYAGGEGTTVTEI